MRIPTVMIAIDYHKRGYAIINECDFDPKRHVLYGEDAARVALTPKPIRAVTMDTLSDDQLRALIAERTGRVPHHRTGRVRLVEMLDGLNDGD